MPTQTGTAPDGKGGINEVKVDSEGRALSRALAESDLQHAVKEDSAFTFFSNDTGAQGGEEVWFLQNDGDDILVDRIVINTATASIFNIKRQTSGTAAGTVMEGRNMTAGLAIMSDVTAFGSAAVTGTVAGDDILSIDILASTPTSVPLNGYKLPKGQAIFVEVITTGAILITGFVHRD